MSSDALSKLVRVCLITSKYLNGTRIVSSFGTYGVDRCRSAVTRILHKPMVHKLFQPAPRPDTTWSLILAPLESETGATFVMTALSEARRPRFFTASIVLRPCAMSIAWPLCLAKQAMTSSRNSCAHLFKLTVKPANSSSFMFSVCGTQGSRKACRALRRAPSPKRYPSSFYHEDQQVLALGRRSGGGCGSLTCARSNFDALLQVLTSISRKTACAPDLVPKGSRLEPARQATALAISASADRARSWQFVSFEAPELMRLRH